MEFNIVKEERSISVEGFRAEGIEVNKFAYHLVFLGNGSSCLVFAMSVGITKVP